MTTCESCTKSDCSSLKRNPNESEADFKDRQKLQSRLCRVRHKVLVLSGKGGVGKSTVAVNLAMALRMAGKRVGLLDIDIHGPSVPTMLGLEYATVRGEDGELLPVETNGLKVVSTGFFLRNLDDALIWRGPLKMAAIKQFLKDVAWGDLDFLIVDSPPGTGDEPLSVIQLIGRLDGAVIVTTPQRVAASDVRKSITFCRQMEVPILGVVENMNGFACPRCGDITFVFGTGGGKQTAAEMKVPYLGSIPIDPEIAEACDQGRAYVYHYTLSKTAKIMADIIQPIAALDAADSDLMNKSMSA
jgi:ATP-binding protein involved in chromosome partitioning